MLSPMLDSVTVTTPGGIVLYNKQFVNSKKKTLALINAANAQRLASNPTPSTVIEGIRISVAGDAYLVYAMHPQQYSLPYTDELLSTLQESLQDYLLQEDTLAPSFDAFVDQLLLTLESSQTDKKLPRAFSESKKYETSLEHMNETKFKKPAAYAPKHKKGKPLGDGIGQVSNDGTYNTLELEVKDSKSDTPATSSFFNVFKSVTKQAPLTLDDLEKPLLKMKEHLVTKNVAAPIAAKLCESVGKGLQGQTLSTFSSLNNAIKIQMEDALSRILTPSSSTDILGDIAIKKESGFPYTMCFIGVNGVGKSTNLSKVCFWLLQNKCSVLIAACDTFRSGAVEQLGVHVRNLGELGGGRVELFNKGYGKDPAGIAKDAVGYAAREGFDVVLIDTAGRMQDNEPLMPVNDPDKIVFVGEALVGSESMDQLSKFNQSLKDFSGLSQPRTIDGMILSKFDTIDDKVGAALSMTYITGKPILFVGVGQTYTDLRRMNVKSIVQTLLQQ